MPLALRLILLPEGEPPNKPDGSPGLRDVKRWKKWCSKNHWKSRRKNAHFYSFFTLLGSVARQDLSMDGTCQTSSNWNASSCYLQACLKFKKRSTLFYPFPIPTIHYPNFFYSRQATGTTYKLCDRMIPMQCWSLSSQISLRFVKAGRHGKPRGLKHGKLSGLPSLASCCVSLDARYFYVIYPFLDFKDEYLPVFVWKNMHKRITSPNTGTWRVVLIWFWIGRVFVYCITVYIYI